MWTCDIVSLFSLYQRTSFSSSNVTVAVSWQLCVARLINTALKFSWIDDDDDDYDDDACMLCRSVKFVCNRPCYIAELASKSSSSSATTTATTTVAATGGGGGSGSVSGGGECLSEVRHRRVVCTQPVGPVRCRSTPGLPSALFSNIGVIKSVFIQIYYFMYFYFGVKISDKVS